MNEVALPPRRSLPDAQAWRGEMSDVGLDWVGMQGIALPLELAGKPLMAKVDAGINLRAEAAGRRTRAGARTQRSRQLVDQW